METKKQFSGWPGDCSTQQLEALKKFQQIVISMKLSLDTYDQHYLLRFLRARKFDLKETEKMWVAFIDWRVKNNVDTIQNFKLPEIPQVRKVYPHGYHKTDKLFRPIYIQRIGKLDVQELWKFTNQTRMLDYYILSYEYLINSILKACTAAKVKAGGDATRVSQTVNIFDLKNFSLGNASKGYDFIKIASKLCQDNYPEILGTMLIINAPMLFSGIWMMIKPWLDAKTVKKIKILGSSYKKELLEFIDAQNLPDFIDGGKCKCAENKGDCLGWNIGPWNPDGKQIFPTALA